MKVFLHPILKKMRNGERENKVWLEWSRSIALSLVDYMDSNGIEQKWFGRAFGCFLHSISVKFYLGK